MMFIWLVIWLIAGGFEPDQCPRLEQWNGWAVWLMIAISVDLVMGHYQHD